MNGSRSKLIKNEFRKWFRIKFGMEPAKTDFRKMIKTYKNGVQRDFYKRSTKLVQKTSYGKEKEIDESKSKEDVA